MKKPQHQLAAAVEKESTRINKLYQAAIQRGILDYQPGMTITEPRRSDHETFDAYMDALGYFLGFKAAKELGTAQGTYCAPDKSNWADIIWNELEANWQKAKS